MPVGIDEPGRDHVALGVDRFTPLDRLLGDGDDLAALDAHVANRVELGLGIHDATVQDHEIEVLGMAALAGASASPFFGAASAASAGASEAGLQPRSATRQLNMTALR